MLKAFNTALGAFSDPGELLLQVLNSVWDPLSIQNDQLQYIFVNDALCAFHGKKREELLGRTLPEILHNKQMGAAWDQDKAVLETGMERLEKGAITDAAGKTRSLVIKRARITDKAGRNYIFCIMKELEEKSPEIREPGTSQQKSPSAIPRDVIHDLNNALNIIRGYSELFLEEMAPEDPVRKDMEAIHYAGQLAAELASKI